MNDKQFKKLVKQSQEATVQEPLTMFLKKAFPNMTIKQGCAVWWLLMNRGLIVDREDISGSFRYNGSCIANVIGKKTDYLHFYCSYPREHLKYEPRKEHNFTIKYALKQIKTLENNGAKIKNLLGEPPIEQYFLKKSVRDWIVMWYFKIIGKIYREYRYQKVQWAIRKHGDV